MPDPDPTPALISGVTLHLICPECGLLFTPYRLHTGEDSRRAREMSTHYVQAWVNGTGAAHIPAHGCKGDHAEVKP